MVDPYNNQDGDVSDDTLEFEALPEDDSQTAKIRRALELNASGIKYFDPSLFEEDV